MTRTAVRRLVLSLGVGLLACSLLLAAVAAAAAPKKNARFSGHTAVAPIGGFRAPVTFKVAANGRSLLGFTYGTLGCFGAGGFPPHVNPYKGGAIIRLSGRIKVASNGKVSVTGATSTTASGVLKQVTTVTIAARFSSSKRISGTITFFQRITGAVAGTVVDSSCGPGRIGFSARTR